MAEGSFLSSVFLPTDVWTRCDGSNASDESRPQSCLKVFCVGWRIIVELWQDWQRLVLSPLRRLSDSCCNIVEYVLPPCPLTGPNWLAASKTYGSWYGLQKRCWKVNFDSREVNVGLKWLKTQTSAKGHRSAYIYTVVLVPSDSYHLRLKHVPIIS
jgi:hypothetical protein